jgi:hypothetical protein
MPLATNAQDFHTEVIQSQKAVTGVQAKLSLHITGNNKDGTEVACQN